MSTFDAQTFQNEYLPRDGSEVNAIVTVTCSGGGGGAVVPIPQQRAEVIIVDVSGSMLHPRGKLKAARDGDDGGDRLPAGRDALRRDRRFQRGPPRLPDRGQARDGLGVDARSGQGRAWPFSTPSGAQRSAGG